MTPPKAKNMSGNEPREFWIGLGKEIGESKQCTQALKEKVDSLMSNHIPHLAADVKELDGKLDKLALRIAYIVGIISAISFAVQVLAKVLSK